MLKRPNGNTLHTRVDIAVKKVDILPAHVKLTADADNGKLVKLGALLEGELMAKAEVSATDGAAREDLYIIKAPEIIADEYSKANNALKKFYNEAGDIVKANEFGDKYNVEKRYGSYEELANDPDVELIYISKEGIDASGVDELRVGQYVKAGANGKFVAATANTNAIGKIVKVKTEGVKVFEKEAAQYLNGNVYDMYYIEMI